MMDRLEKQGFVEKVGPVFDRLSCFWSYIFFKPIYS